MSIERGVHKRYAAVAFDYFVLFNPDSVVAVVDRIAPGKGESSPICGGHDSSSTAGCG